MRWILIGLVALILIAAAILITRARKPVAGPVPTPTETLSTAFYPFTSPSASSIPSISLSSGSPIPTYKPITSTTSTLPQTGIGVNILVGTVVAGIAGVVLVKKFKLL